MIATPSPFEVAAVIAGGFAIAAMAVLLVHAGFRELRGIWRDFDAGRAARPAREREGWRV